MDSWKQCKIDKFLTSGSTQRQCSNMKSIHPFGVSRIVISFYRVQLPLDNSMHTVNGY